MNTGERARSGPISHVIAGDSFLLALHRVIDDRDTVSDARCYCSGISPMKRGRKMEMIIGSLRLSGH